jgi:hypothetical protein
MIIYANTAGENKGMIQVKKRSPPIGGKKWPREGGVSRGENPSLKPGHMREF